MSVLTHVPSLPSSTTTTDTMLVIGEVSHYHFYQSLNHRVFQHHPHRSLKYRPTTKKIIPSAPRQHSKAPANSPLSFIRQHKLPHHAPTFPTTSTDTTSQQLSQSSAGLLSNMPSFPGQRQQASTGLDRQRRPRKVSFNEKVMVICTRIDDDDDNKEEEETLESTRDSASMVYYQGRRHSTGERQPPWLSFVNTLKYWRPAAPLPPSIT